METKKKQRKTQKGQQVMDFTEDQARDFFEKRRWPEGPACVHCGSVNVYRLDGAAHRKGLLECREPECRKQFSVTVGTVMEDSHLPLATWAKAFHLMVSSKKGISSLQLQRNLGLGSYRTAWFLTHRIREAMRCEPVAGLLKGQVQVDETMIGGRRSRKDPKWSTHKTPVMVLMETDGRAVAHPIPNTQSKTLRKAMVKSIDPSAQVVTDEFPAYQLAAGIFADHQTVNHSEDEYSRKQWNNDTRKVETITTNSAEGFFALLKRGVHGTFHHVSQKHLHRYCDEFSFRWSHRKTEDVDRRDLAIVGVEGKRLMLKSPVQPKIEPKQDGDQLPMF